MIVDVDIHHAWRTDADLLGHLAPEWRDYFTSAERSRPGRASGPLQPAHLRFPQIDGSAMRVEATPPDGGAAGSSYELLRDQHLDPHGIDRALLTWNYGPHPGYFHAAASVALCRASNEFMVEQWLDGRDSRLYGALAVPVGVPTAAAAEVRRFGGHPQIAAVLVSANPFCRPFGHPVYHPIYAAAEEFGLPVVIHVGTDHVGKGSWIAGGLPTTKVEYYTLQDQVAAHHVTSMIAEGVFETFPGLRLLLNEMGFTWVPWLMWGLDSRYAALKRESPSLTRLPSEYFREHVWLSTQPFSLETPMARVMDLLESFGGLDERLCYSSDYPHWDTEWPRHVAPFLPKAWRSKVMGENACRLFGWSDAAADSLIADKVQVGVTG